MLGEASKEFIRSKNITTTMWKTVRLGDVRYSVRTPKTNKKPKQRV